MQITNDNKKGMVRVIKHDKIYILCYLISHLQNGGKEKGWSAYSMGVFILNFG